MQCKKNQNIDKSMFYGYETWMIFAHKQKHLASTIEASYSYRLFFLLNAHFCVFHPIVPLPSPCTPAKWSKEYFQVEGVCRASCSKLPFIIICYIFRRCWKKFKLGKAALHTNGLAESIKKKLPKLRKSSQSWEKPKHIF